VGFVRAQTGCNVGFETPLYPTALFVPTNTIFAIKVTASYAGTLTDLSMASFPGGI
jgi:hypothetical protein